MYQINILENKEKTIIFFKQILSVFKNISNLEEVLIILINI
jgi:hypothetical protein